MGVRNAILKIVKEINTSPGDIYVYGPLIHNPQTIDVLTNRGLKTVTDLDGIHGKEIAIRTHGITIEENKKLKKHSQRLINLTCPRVSRVQSIIKKYSHNGYYTIIIGDSSHAEVIGLKSYAAKGVTVISSKDDISEIPERSNYILVSQTTLDRHFFDSLVTFLTEKFRNIEIIDTICDSTRLRQEDVISGIKRGIDTLVVVGGKNSANTKRLAKIGQESGIKTFYIETEDEISGSDFDDSDNVLVTAGASTPGWIINNVLEKLFNIKFKKTHFVANTVKILMEMIVRTNLLSAIAAFFMTLAAQMFYGVDLDIRYPLISFFYIFSMHSINNYFDRNFLKACNSYKYLIYDRFGLELLFVSLLFMAVSIVLAVGLNYESIIILVLSYIFGFAYSTSPVKSFVKKVPIQFLRRVYSTKVITSFGWLLVVAFLPLLTQAADILSFLSLISLILGYVFIRHILIDLIALQGDLIFGRETLPIIAGIRNIRTIIYSFSGISIIFLILSALYGGDYFVLLYIINFLYFITLFYKINRTTYLISLKYELLVDFNYLLMIIFSLIQLYFQPGIDLFSALRIIP
jgi:4-hydroxy-3-methylbut-2-enyl diphosphate reductase